MMKTQDIEKLEDSKTEAGWNRECKRIRFENGGQYPDDWYTSIVTSGVAHRAGKRFAMRGKRFDIGGASSVLEEKKK